jgi:hypothetical protein
MTFSHDAAGKRMNKPSTGPGSRKKISRTPKDLSQLRLENLLRRPDAAPAVIKYPNGNRQLTIEYSSELLAAYCGPVDQHRRLVRHQEPPSQPLAASTTGTGRRRLLGRADSAATKRSWAVRWTVDGIFLRAAAELPPSGHSLFSSQSEF